MRRRCSARGGSCCWSWTRRAGGQRGTLDGHAERVQRIYGEPLGSRALRKNLGRRRALEGKRRGEKRWGYYWRVEDVEDAGHRGLKTQTGAENTPRQSRAETPDHLPVTTLRRARVLLVHETTAEYPSQLQLRHPIQISPCFPVPAHHGASHRPTLPTPRTPRAELDSVEATLP